MTKQQKKALKNISAAFDGVKVTHSKRLNGPHPSLVKAATTANTVGYVGWINHAGRSVDGTYQVQFDISGNGWSSRWPEWAYEVALAALTSRKRVLVIATGEPYGPNLLSVLVLNQEL